jgi:hypothetical protein
VPDFKNPQALNRYSYVLNNPLSFIDPTGHDPDYSDPYWYEGTYGFDGTGGASTIYSSFSSLIYNFDQSINYFAVPIGNYILNSLDYGASLARDFVTDNQTDIDGILFGIPILRAAEVGSAVRLIAQDVGISIRGTLANEVGGIRIADAERIAANAKRGREAEEALRSVIGEKTALQVNGGTRVIDGMTETALNEVKNVKYQAWTQQLNDFATAASPSERNMQFNLWINQDARVSSTLLQKWLDGCVNIIPTKMR